MSQLSSVHVPAWGVSLRQVIQVTSQRGEGTDGNPVRPVTQYFASEGGLLAEFDHLHDAPDMAALEVVRLRQRVAELEARLAKRCRPEPDAAPAAAVGQGA